MIAVLTLGEPFDAELAAVCTALFSRCRMPLEPLRVRRYARLLEGSNPHTWAACSLGLRLAPTIQSESEAFQRVELEYVVSDR